MNPALLAVLALSVLASACGGTDSAPSNSNATTSYTGTWAGTATSPIAGTGNIRVTMAQTNVNLSGTWSATYANIQNNNSGTLSGSVTGVSITLVLLSSVPSSCPYNLTGTRSGNTITGTFATVNCSGSSSGPFSVTKQ